MSKDSFLFLEDVYSKDMSVFKSVVMCFKEAKFINAQSVMGNIELYEKPTTISIHKFKKDLLTAVEEETPSDSEDQKEETPSDSEDQK